MTGIWLSVPIGWALADAIGIGYYFKNKKTKAAAWKTICLMCHGETLFKGMDLDALAPGWWI